MTQSTLQITLNINGSDSYIMKYPETVKLTLEMSRSEEWWGVFLSVVETFQAIKEDRQYLLKAFNEWAVSGYAEDFYINIDIAVLEYEEYNRIYKGVALPDYTDNTNYFKCKFSEVGNIQKFLDRSIERVFNMENDSLQYYFPDNDGLQGVFDVINAINEEDYYPLINVQEFTEDDEIRDIDFGSGLVSEVYQKAFAKGEDESEYNYIGNIKTDSTRSYFFSTDNNSIIVAKRTSLQVFMRTGNYQIVPYAKKEDVYRGASTFQINCFLNDRSDSDTLTFVRTIIGGNTHFLLNDSNMTVSNNSTTLKYLSWFGKTTGLTDGTTNLPNQTTAYLKSLLPLQWALRFVYTTTNNIIDHLPGNRILAGLFQYDMDSFLQNNLYAFSFLPTDAVLPYTSKSTITINIADFLEEIKKALCVGVTVNPESQRLVLKPIQNMFSDTELFTIEEDQISNFEISLNDFLKVGKLTLGAEDRKFDYPDTSKGQNIKTTYTARNTFSGSLDLNLNRYKAQSYDFIDAYRKDVFNLSEDDKNDGEFVLFQKMAIAEDRESTKTRFVNINNSYTAPSQVASWAWLLRTISPNGFDLQSEENPVEAYNSQTGDVVNISGNIEPSDSAFREGTQKITLRKFNAVFKLTTEQYNRIVNNRDGYLTLIYKDVTYKGYINNLSLQIGKNMLATAELLERYEP